MLRADLANVNPVNLPTLLYQRNPGLRGEFEVKKTKIFTSDNKTKRRQSMDGWRLLELKGDREFHESLAKYDEDHKFNISGKTIQIKGGTRKQTAEATGNNSSYTFSQKQRFNTPGPSNNKGKSNVNANRGKNNSNCNILDYGRPIAKSLISFHDLNSGDISIGEEIMISENKRMRESMESGGDRPEPKKHATEDGVRGGR